MRKRAVELRLTDKGFNFFVRFFFYSLLNITFNTNLQIIIIKRKGFFKIKFIKIIIHKII